MRASEIVETLLGKLAVAAGRHLYGVLGSYRALDEFAKTLQEANAPNGTPFPRPLNVNRAILDAIPDDEFKRLVEKEAQRPEPTAKHVAKAFKEVLRAHLTGKGLLVLSNLEMLFAYRVELDPLRTLATDEDRILLLLPGKRTGDKVFMFHESDEANCTLPKGLIAGDRLWAISEGK